MPSPLAATTDNPADQDMTFKPGNIIPQSFWLAGIKFRVLWGNIHAENGRILAKSEYSSQCIILDPSITPLQTIEQAYVHQMFDLILTVCNEKEIRQNYLLMTSFSHFLYQALKSFVKRPLSDLADYVCDDSSHEDSHNNLSPIPASKKEFALSMVATSIVESGRDTTIIPKTVSVGGLVFTVHIHKIHPDKGVQPLGTIDYARQRILIDPTLASLQATEQSFFHEIVHLLFYVCGASELRVNERLVDVIAQFLYQAIMTAEPRLHTDLENAIKQLTNNL